MTMRSFFVAAAALVAAQVIGCAAAQASNCKPQPECDYAGSPYAGQDEVALTVAFPTLTGRNYRTIDSGGFAGWIGPLRRYRVLSELQWGGLRPGWVLRSQKCLTLVEHGHGCAVPETAQERVARHIWYPRFQNQSWLSQGRQVRPRSDEPRCSRCTQVEVAMRLANPRLANESMRSQYRGWHGGGGSHGGHR